MNIVSIIPYFDWLNPTKIPVVWSINGGGEYGLGGVGGPENYVSPVDIPVDIYINEWV